MDKEEQLASFEAPGLFIGSVVAYTIFVALRALTSLAFTVMASTGMHNYVSNRLIRAKILFFDSNPIGRIVTRFSKDVMILDFVIGPFIVFIANGLFRTFTVCITVGIINPWLFIGIVLCSVLMYIILRIGSGVMIKSQVLDGVLRGPIHNTFAMIIQGLVTFRAFDRIDYFKQDFNNTLEKCANATFAFNVSNRWVGLRLDFVCSIFTVLTTGFAMAMRNTFSPELLILSV